MTLFKDLKHAVRMLVKNPGFSVTAILALALGIGANASIFSVVNAVGLRPFPYRDPGRLLLISESVPKLGCQILTVPAPDTVAFQTQSQTFDAVGSFQNLTHELSGRGHPVRVRTARLSASVFQVLDVSPVLGRTFTEEEDKSDHKVAVLSYAPCHHHFSPDHDLA